MVTSPDAPVGTVWNQSSLVLAKEILKQLESKTLADEIIRLGLIDTWNGAS